MEYECELSIIAAVVLSLAGCGHNKLTSAKSCQQEGGIFTSTRTGYFCVMSTEAGPPITPRNVLLMKQDFIKAPLVDQGVAEGEDAPRGLPPPE
jgi:hypothetical protein